MELEGSAELSPIPRGRSTVVPCRTDPKDREPGKDMDLLILKTIDGSFLDPQGRGDFPSQKVREVRGKGVDGKGGASLSGRGVCGRGGGGKKKCSGTAGLGGENSESA